MKGKLHGRAGGYFAEEVAKADTAHIAWQAILARFFNGLRKNDYRMFPFNRKHAWRGIYLPSVGTPGPEHIVVAVDTSGSMDDETLGKVLAELDQLRSVTECKLTLIECDAKTVLFLYDIGGTLVDQFSYMRLFAAQFQVRSDTGQNFLFLKWFGDKVNSPGFETPHVFLNLIQSAYKDDWHAECPLILIETFTNLKAICIR